MRFKRLLLLVGLLSFLPAPAFAECAGIKLYPEADFGGATMPLTESVANLHLWEIGDDGASLLVPGGCRAVFYDERHFVGASFEIVGPAFSRDLSLGAWADRISSVQLFATGDAPRAARLGVEIDWATVVTRAPALPQDHAALAGLAPAAAADRVDALVGLGAVSAIGAGGSLNP